MSLSINAFSISDKKIAEKITRFLDVACGSTIFHYPQFLSYHDNRFASREIYLAWQKGEQISAVMPAALFNEDKRITLRSPYGASFGGIVSKSILKLKDSIAVADGLIDFCKRESVDDLVITLPPQIYFPTNNDSMLFALERAGFNLVSRDVFSVVDISAGYEQVWASYEGRARTAIRKSLSNFDVEPNAPLGVFYPILLEDKRRLGSKPTHTLDELLRIKEKFPDRIWADIAVHKETGAKAGICYFAVTDNVIMTFYMSQETAVLKHNGVNVLVDYGIKKAVERCFRFFDFGSSTVGYEVQNIGVANFKESFGAISSSRLTYQWRREGE